MSRQEFVTVLYRIMNPVVQPKADPDAKSFNDVAPDRWSYDAIEWSYENGIIRPDDGGAFHPEGLITRAEMAVMLVNAGLLTDIAENTFSDIENHPYRDDILKAVFAGVYEGYPDGTIKPDNNATRYEVITAVVRFMLRGEPTGDMWAGLETPYTDVPRSHWAYKYVALATFGCTVPL